MFDYRRQIVLELCNSFFREDLHVFPMATQVLEGMESGTGYFRSAIILQGTENQPPRLFAHSRKQIQPDRFIADMTEVDNILASKSCGGVVKHTLANNETTIIDNVEENDVYISADEVVRSEICLPLVQRGAVIGALNVEARTPSAFGRADVTLLSTISTQLALFFGSTASANELASPMTLIERHSAAY